MAIAPLPDEFFPLPASAARPRLRLLPDPGGEWGTDGQVTAGRRSPGGPRPTLDGRAAANRVRRRRVAALTVAVGLLALLALPARALGASSSTPAGRLAAGTLYTVRPGDTLWSIAQRVDPSGDPRVLVAELGSETGSDTVTVGEHLRLP
jgi:hypothetical protein